MSMSMFMPCRNAINVIGNGVVVHVPSLFEEIAELEQKGVDVSVLIVITTNITAVITTMNVPFMQLDSRRNLLQQPF